MKHLSLLTMIMALALCGASARAGVPGETFKSGETAELKKSVTWEKILSTPAPLPIIGKIKPEDSDLSKPSRWSVGCETMDRDYADFEAFKQFVGKTGIGYGRLQSGWAKCEPQKGKYNFGWLDAHVDGLIAQGVHPWICLCYGNPIYSDDGYDLDAKLFPEGKVMDAWDRYVAEVVKRYKGKVTMYEVWNEPDGGGHTDSYDTYATLFAHTAKVIRKYDGDVKIAAFGICTPDRKTPDGGNYVVESVKKIKELGQLGNLDYITYHAYWHIPERINPFVKQLREELDAIGCTAPLLQGETGCPGQLEYGHAMKNTEWNEYSQAKWDLRQGVNHFGMDIPYSVFTMVDLNYGWMLQSFGLVRMQLNDRPVYLRPKFYAVQHLCSVFNADITPDCGVTVESCCGRKIACVGLSKGGRTVGCALWFCDRIPSGDLDRTLTSVTVKGLGDMKNLVYVDMLSGYIHQLPSLSSFHCIGPDGTLSFSQLPLWDCPVVLIDPSALN